MDNDQTSETHGGTGTRDVTYDLTAVLYHALQGVENCQIYMGDASGRQEHRQFFEGAMQAQKQLAAQAKQLLHDCLMQESGGGSAGDPSTGAMGQQGMSAGPGAIAGGIASTPTHSFDEASEDGSASRLASGQTDGGSDQFEGASEQDGHDGLGQDQLRNEISTGGGGASSF